MGRWLTPDPLGFSASQNLYAFVQNDPLTHIDEYGLYSVPISYLNPSERFASFAYQPIKATVLNSWNSPQFQGALQMGFGLGEATGGAAYTVATGGVGGLAGGGFMFFRGLDNVYTGARQIISNKWMDSGKSQLLQACGIPRNFAEGIDTALSFGSPKNASRVGSSFLGGLFGKSEEVIQYTKSNLRLGQQMHKSYKAGETILNKKTKEFVLPSGRKIDFLDRVNGKVYELKPNNPRAIREGQKQLQRYIEELKTVSRFKDI